MDLDGYFARRCVCGLPRDEHAHGYDEQGRLHVIGVTNGCFAFRDEIELALGGNPLLNPLLKDGMRERLIEAGMDLSDYPERHLELVKGPS